MLTIEKRPLTAEKDRLSLPSKKALKTQHLEELRRSAIDEEIAHRNFKSLSGNNAYEYLMYALSEKHRRNGGTLRAGILKKYSHIYDGGWWCGSKDPENGEDRLFGQFKPDKRRDDEDGDPIKYETPPNCQTEPLFLEPSHKAWKKIAKRYNIQQYGKEFNVTDFWNWIKVHPQIPIILTEGAKKAASILSAGFVPIPVVGVWNTCTKTEVPEHINHPDLIVKKDIKTKETKYYIPELHPDLERFTENRTWYIAYDQDSNPKTIKNVAKAIKRVGRLLIEKGSKVKVCCWDASLGKGVDDLIFNHGVGGFEKAIAGARLLIDSPTGQVKLENLSPSPSQKAEDPDLSPPSDSEWIWTQEGYSALFADRPWITVQGEMYRWDGTHYESVEDALLLRKIARWLNNYAVEGKGEWDYQCKYAKPSNANTILEWAKQLTSVSLKDINPPGLNLTNGILKIEWTGRTPHYKLIPHDPSQLYTYCSAGKYDPIADPADCDRLLSALSPCQQDIFLKLIAASLDLEKIRRLPKVGRMRAILCQGTGSNGKDSLREAVSQLFGGQGMSSCSLSDFRQYDQGRKFPLSPLGRNPRINWSSENTGSLSLDHVQSLKQAISGDPLTAEQKGKDGVDIDVKTVFFFNVNEAPLLSASLDAIATRYCILTFDKTFKTDPNLSYGELQADPLFKHDPHFIRDNILPALLNKILDALARLPDEGINYAATDEALNEIRRESNHLIAFCQDVGLQIVRNGKTYIKDIWARLEQWYIDNGTLEIDETDGRKKYFWNEQVRRSDLNVKRNHVAARFQRLFPKAKKGKDSYVYLQGIAFSDEIEGSVRDRGEKSDSIPSLASHSSATPPCAIVRDRSRSPAIVSDRTEERKIDSSSQEVNEILSDREGSTSIANDRERSRMLPRMSETPEEQTGKEFSGADKSDRECSSPKIDSENFTEAKVHNRVEENIAAIVEDLRVCESLDTYEAIAEASVEVQEVLRADGIVSPGLFEEAISRLSPEQQATIKNLDTETDAGSDNVQNHPPVEPEEDQEEQAIQALVRKIEACRKLEHWRTLQEKEDPDLLAIAFREASLERQETINRQVVLEQQEEDRRRRRELNHVNPFKEGDTVAMLGSVASGLGTIVQTHKDQCKVQWTTGYEGIEKDSRLIKVGETVLYGGEDENLKLMFISPKAKPEKYRSRTLIVKSMKPDGESIAIEVTAEDWTASFWVDLRDLNR